MNKIISKIKSFLYKKVNDSRLTEPRIFMKIHRKDFVNTLRVDMVDILAAQKVNEETFKKYKNCNEGKNIAIIATGPSLNQYKPLKDVLNLGVNKSIFREDIDFDYVFMQDYIAVKDYINNLEEERFKNTKKFFGIIQDYTYNGDATIPESISVKLKAERYCIFNQWSCFNEIFPRDIAYAPLATANSVGGSAIQFALYTNPQKIYLVGMDCSCGHFDSKKKNDIDLSYTINTWKKIKRFAEIYYPDTEIISVNPVGLKGIFTDLCQEERKQ